MSRLPSSCPNPGCRKAGRAIESGLEDGYHFLKETCNVEGMGMKTVCHRAEIFAVEPGGGGPINAIKKKIGVFTVAHVVIKSF